MSETIKRLRGLVALLGSTVENGASAVERIHTATARTPFRVLEQTPSLIATPAALVEKVQSATVAGVYESIRLITRVAVKALDVALDAADTEEPNDPESSEG